jgi:hypothetical protein
MQHEEAFVKDGMMGEFGAMENSTGHLSSLTCWKFDNITMFPCHLGIFLCGYRRGTVHSQSKRQPHHKPEN